MTAPGSRADRYSADKPGDNRNAFERDRDRIIYTSAYRRLAGVTQVVSALEGHVFHNRLTHTIKVAQVTRRLAENLVRSVSNGPAPIDLDPDAAEAAAHAHDLGHPPFGHVAEVELQRLVAPLDSTNSFEGNAQSFRIVTKVARAHPDYQGLNLTRATLDGILKYPWFHDPGDPKARKKWGAYTSEVDHFRFARSISAGAALPTPPERQGLEAQVMDWADDITYAVHDLEDLYRASLIPADRLQASQGVRDEFASWVFNRWQATGKIVAQADIEKSLLVFPTLLGSSTPYDGSASQRVALRLFTSTLIGRYVQATSVVFDNTSGQWNLSILPYARREVDVLKELTWRYVIERPALAAQQHGQKAVVATLFNTFMDATDTAAPLTSAALLPARVQEDVKALAQAGQSTPATRARVVCDAICSMTEDEALRLYARLSGHALGTVLDSIV